MQQAHNGVNTAVRKHAEAYSDGEERPLGGYATVLAVFASLLAAVTGLVYATRGTRVVAGAFTARTGAGFVHLAYAAAQRMAT
jgi:hypothetical protein